VLTCAVAPGAGGEFVVRVGEKSIAGSVSSTGGWANFKTVTLGRVALAGRASVFASREVHARAHESGVRAAG